MDGNAAFIGFGEAAGAFAWAGARGYDLLLDDATTRPGKLTAFASVGARACDTAAAALDGASVAFSLVTADQALSAAKGAAALLTPGALWLDMNSVAPDTKRAAAAAIEAAGGRYVDVAVMAPVHPKRRAVPLLVSGPHASAARDALVAAGFSSVNVIDGAVGAASAVKMIRSVMVKGIEALSAECVLAADAAGVRDAVIASLDASWPGAGWQDRFDYNLDRMMVHGLRRAAEMDEVVSTLEALGTGAAMSVGTAARQRAIGRLSIAPPDGLDAKLRVLAPFVRRIDKDRAA